MSNIYDAYHAMVYTLSLHCTEHSGCSSYGMALCIELRHLMRGDCRVLIIVLVNEKSWSLQHSYIKIDFGSMIIHIGCSKKQNLTLAMLTKYLLKLDLFLRSSDWRMDNTTQLVIFLFKLRASSKFGQYKGKLEAWVIYSVAMIHRYILLEIVASAAASWFTGGLMSGLKWQEDIIGEIKKFCDAYRYLSRGKHHQ